jgi:hypothetical protein
MKKGFFIAALLLVNFCAFSQINSVAEAKSIYIYNFSRMVQWPTESYSNGFTIGVIGANEVYSYLVPYVKNKKVGNLPITVKKFDDASGLSQCNIIYVGNSKIQHFSEIVSRLQGSNSLIITEKKGMINSGAAIDLYIDLDQSKIKFVLNASNAEKYDLTVSKGLSDMAM